jgi:putative transposase
MGEAAVRTAEPSPIRRVTHRGELRSHLTAYPLRTTPPPGSLTRKHFHRTTLQVTAGRARVNTVAPDGRLSASATPPRSIDEAVAAQEFRLVAFVFMPEHVHLLVFPTRNDTTAESISAFLIDVKMPSSQQIKQDLMATGSRLLAKLTIRERPGKMVFRFWQEGPGYDRNLQTEASVLAAIEYIHLNPVRRGLCKKITDWRWSSARWYVSDGAYVDPALPAIHGPPVGFLNG